MTSSDPRITRTGRIQSWMDNPTSRLPVSCTVFVVEDKMEGRDGIEDSWNYVSYALRHGAGVAVHLSNLRPKGHDNGRGLVSSGPVSFAKIYSTLNETLRRGGVYKNGAVVIHLDIDHADILEFVNTPRSELDWVKRCVDLTPNLWKAASSEVKQAIIKGISRGDIWLNKIQYEDGKRIYGNVCLEVYLPHRGTCLLQHVNLGQCRPIDLIDIIPQAMQELCELHPNTRVSESGHYLSPRTDKQVGLGFLGLANFLRLNQVTYKEFADALDWLLEGYVPGLETLTPAQEIVVLLERGINAAADIAEKYGMQRSFAIAPTANCSYSSKDLEGFTCAPEIAPPVSRLVDRDSGTFGVESYDYGPIETASDVGWDDYFRVTSNFVELLDCTGQFHGYSFNSWSDVVTYDEDFIQKWLDSYHTSLYYSLQVMDGTQDKTNALAALGSDADALLQDLFAPLTPEELATGRVAPSEQVEGYKIECFGCAE